MSAPASAVIVAGGGGHRIGGPPKQFREIGNRPMLAWSCERFARHPDVGRIVVVLPADVVAEPPAWLRRPGLELTAGGPTRRASVRAGLAALAAAESAPVVLIHDAARPFVSDGLIGGLADAAAAGPVIPVVPLADAIKRMQAFAGDAAAIVESTIDRTCLRAAQTPQAFPFALIHRLHEAAEEEGVEPPDDAALCERAGVTVRTVPGERWAWKITHPEDLAVAEWLVSSGRVAWPAEVGVP